MLVRLFVALPICVSFGGIFTPSLAETTGLSGISVPDKLDVADIYAIHQQIVMAKCTTDHSKAWGYTAVGFDRFDRAISHPGTNVWLGRPKDEMPTYHREGSEALKKLLNPVKPIFPAICEDLVFIARRDGQNNQHSLQLASMTFELARRISSTKLDCLGQILPLITNAEYRVYALGEAYDFCIDDRTQDCRRLKPK